MSAGKHTVRDLVEEAKKRIVLLMVCVFGLSYLMSLTSSSVWINLPAAASLIIFLRYISLDLDVRRKAISNNVPPLLKRSFQKRSIELFDIPVDKLSWRRKVNSPVVEAAIDQFTRHLVSEWVTDLWYSRITPDKDGPEELVQIMNGVLGEVSYRSRDINLIDLLTRDIIGLFCNHLELYRFSQAKIGKEQLEKLSIDHRDEQLKLVMSAERKLHPALVSAEAEHKALQHLVTGVISLTFKSGDLQCSFFRLTARELLACSVLRPVLNLINPRFINEKIESLFISLSKKTHGVSSTNKHAGPSKSSMEQFSGFLHDSSAGVELVQFKHDNSTILPNEKLKLNSSDTCHSKGPRSPNGTSISVNMDASSGEWGNMLDVISTRKTRALAPEHFENMWTKGRNYKKKENGDCKIKQLGQEPALQATRRHSKGICSYPERNNTNTNDSSSQSKDKCSVGASCAQTDGNHFLHSSCSSCQEKIAHHLGLDESGADSESSYETDDDDSNNVMGLDTPGIKVWDSKNKRNSAISYIRHPLESCEVNSTKKSSKSRTHLTRIARSQSGRKRSRSSNQKVPLWQEAERTTLSLKENDDMLKLSKENTRKVDLSDDSETESFGRVHSGSAASSSVSTFSPSGDHSSILNPSDSFLMEDSFLKLRCEVLGANIVKSSSGTFAVYSVSVTDATNKSWSIKRRFRHFEDLHRRLKEFPEYNLSLPPKHFLSSGLEVTVVKERCTLLDKYLKMLLQLPTVSESIEVWDFLSVDSQTYIFSDSFSIIQTLSVDLVYKSSEKGVKFRGPEEIVNDSLYPRKENLRSINEDSPLLISNSQSDMSKVKERNVRIQPSNNSTLADSQLQGDTGSDSEVTLSQNILVKGANVQQEPSHSIPEAVTDPTIPIEWVPPNLSAPILDLVDTIFQLQGGGWIRRQIFWICKQVLQLGMGDAFDDWLIEKIQLLRSGSVVAGAIKRVEQILWPDGIFITKHPSRRRPTPLPSPKELSAQKENRSGNLLTNEEQLEAARRSQFVRELIIDKAPAALVGLIGRKEYEQCAEDAYFFLQSSVCVKQLMFELLEIVLLAAFPELDDIVRRLHEDKGRVTVAEKR